MFRKLLRAKLHGGTVTGADLHYEGSIAIDTHLLAVAEIAPYESVQVWNVTNGERFETYTIPAAQGSGELMVNGAAARRVHVGDTIIVAAFGWFASDEIDSHRPRIVLLDSSNRPKST